MPAGNTSRDRANQDPAGSTPRPGRVAPPGSGLEKVEILFRKLNSPIASERELALDAINHQLEIIGLAWQEIFEGYCRDRSRAGRADDAAVAIEAARFLQEANDELTAEVARLRPAHGDNGGRRPAAVPWADVGTRSPQARAKWCVNENIAKRLYLNDFEKLFLPSIAERQGPLSEKQEAVFQQIMAAVARRCGRPVP